MLYFVSNPEVETEAHTILGEISVVSINKVEEWDYCFDKI